MKKPDTTVSIVVSWLGGAPRFIEPAEVALEGFCVAPKMDFRILVRSLGFKQVIVCGTCAVK